MNQLARNRSRRCDTARPVEGALRHLDQRVGPRHLGLAGLEQGVAGLAQGLVDDAAPVRVELAAEVVAAVVVEPAGQRLHRRVDARRVGLQGRGARDVDHRAQLGHRRRLGDGGEPVIEMDRRPGGDRRLIHRHQPLRELPSPTDATAGRPASRTTSPAWDGEIPACQHNQCDNERIPVPSHAPVSRASAASATSWALSTFRWPHTARNRSSIEASGAVVTSTTSIPT